MTIERKTVIDQIEVRRDGTLQVRFGLLLIEGDEELDCKWHRTAVAAGGNIDTQIAAVNAHLSEMGKARVDTAHVDRLKQIAALVHSLGK